MLLAAENFQRACTHFVKNACDSLLKKSLAGEETFKPVLRVTTQLLSQTFEIKFWDNGIGIPISLLDRIFMPFYTARKLEENSVGLGLPICYDIIVRGHRGKIDVRSKENEFAEFVIRLPLGDEKNSLD